MLSRRQLLKLAALTGVSMALPLKWLAKPAPALAFSQSDGLSKFIQPLRIVGAGIPIAQPDTVKQTWWQPGVTHYTIDIGQFEDQLHPELPNPTRLWGFGQGYSPNNPRWATHLGGVIAAKRGQPVQITFRNHLPADHILPIDTTIMGADGTASRADIHLHGGFVPWVSDGGPHAWWDVDGSHGESFLDNQVLRPGQATAPDEAEYYYPNDQSTRLMWYHDHTFGNTRINIYAGIASGYVVYDDYELSLVANNNLPGPLDPRTVYMVFQDKIFVSTTTQTNDPGWFTAVKNSRPGDLWYAHEYDPTRWPPPPVATPPTISAIPEFFGDTMLVNGSVFPYLEVEPRQYRLRILNACNARFLKLCLCYAQEGHLTEPDLTKPGPTFLQFGTEGGFMPAPVELNGAQKLPLLMAPAERVDMIVDFREVDPGSTLILYNDAPAPFPMGDDVNDYYTGNPLNPTITLEGKGPNTRTIMQFRVKAQVDPEDPEIELPSKLTPTDPFLVEQTPGVPTPIPAGVKTRYLTLNEINDSYGRLIQTLGTTDATAPGFFGRAYGSSPTEVVTRDTTEAWEIINLTGDTHPIHFHLVNVQVLSRQLFDAVNYTGGLPTYTAATTAPDLFELGWKETVHVNPGEVTRVLMKFVLPTAPFKVPESPRTGGFEYVWHCHILEHEEHDMMRPLIVEENKIYLPTISK